MKRILAIVIIVLIMVSGREQENRKSKPVQVEPTIIIEPTIIVEVEPTVIPTKVVTPTSCYEELHREILVYMKKRQDPEKMYAVGETCTDDILVTERLKLSVMYDDDAILEKLLNRN